MKTLQLNLAKKLLIVDYENKEKLDEAWDYYKAFGKPTTMFDGTPTKALLKGTFMTQENYKSLLPLDDQYSISKFPKAYLISYSRFENAFKDLIEKEGFHWLENPIEEPTMEKYGWYSANSQEEESGWMYEEGEEKYYKALKEWKHAESRTLRFPIIFEILK